MSKNKLGFYSGLTLAIILFLLGGMVSAQWNEPTAAPPGDNVDAPINVGTDEQYKQGSLLLGGSVIPIPSGARLEVRGGNYGIASFGGGDTSFNSIWDGAFTTDDATGIYGQSPNIGVVGTTNPNNENSRAGVFGLVNPGFPTNNYGNYGILGRFGGPVSYAWNTLNNGRPLVTRAAVYGETSTDKSSAVVGYTEEFSAIRGMTRVPSTPSYGINENMNTGAIEGILRYKVDPPSPPYNDLMIKGSLGYYKDNINDIVYGVRGEIEKMNNYASNAYAYGVAGLLDTNTAGTALYGEAGNTENASLGVVGKVKDTTEIMAAAPLYTAGVLGESEYRDTIISDLDSYDVGQRNYGVFGRMREMDTVELQEANVVEQHNFAGYFAGPLLSVYPEDNVWELWRDQQGNDANWTYDQGDERDINFINNPIKLYGHKRDTDPLNGIDTVAAEGERDGITAIGSAAMDVILRQFHFHTTKDYKLLGELSVESDRALNGIYSVVARNTFTGDYCPPGGCVPVVGTATENELGIDSDPNSVIVEDPDDDEDWPELTGGRVPVYAHNMLNVNSGGKVAALVAHQSGTIMTNSAGYGIYAKPGPVKPTLGGNATAYGIYTSINEAVDQDNGIAYALYADASMGPADGAGNFSKYAGYFNGKVRVASGVSGNNNSIDIFGRDTQINLNVGGNLAARITYTSSNQRLIIDPIATGGSIGTVQIMGNVIIDGTCTGC